MSGRQGRNDVNIDGRTQQHIWQQLKTFQDDPHATALPFLASLSTQDRKYVHKMAANLNFTTKSTGSKNNGSRHVVVYKRAGGDEQERRERDRERDAAEDLLPLPPAIRALVDRFLLSHPLDQIAAFNPLHMTTQPALNPHNNHSSHPHRSHRSQPVPLAAPAASNPRYRAMLGGRERLPIWKQREAILELYERNQVTVISGATGCGKSTQVPQFILDHLSTDAAYQPHSCDIICTQPRRISAIALAERVAAERGEDIGQSVGYQIRLERCASSSTRILFCTVGILLRRLATDPTLSSVSTLIIDECHERERNCDFLLTCLRDLLPSRPSLKLILMSATISEQLFVSYFGAGHIYTPGFTWPVQVFWLADIVELSGWEAGGRGGVVSSRGRQGDGKKEAEMRKRLHELVQRQLYERGQEERKEEQDELRRLDEDSKEAMSREEAIAVLEKRSAERNKPIGWTDTWVFKPEYDTAELGGVDDASGSEAQLRALLQSVNSSGAAPPPAASVMSASAIAEKKQHEERMQHVVVEHSDSTLATVKRLEEEGMDYIDYGLVVAAILYICTSFASNHPSQHQPHASRSQSASYEVDVDNGAILVFLPGWEDINRLLSDLRSHPHFASNASHYSILPLHGSIPSTEQRRIFAKPVAGVRKIVLSTNIAETSITIDDVVFVLDCGKMKEKTYDPYTNMSSLASTWISQANAKQRAGRAGRSRPGVCFRLYSPLMYERMDEYQTPELLRTPLEEVCLQIKLLQLDGVEAFLSRCLQPPAAVAVRTALDLLIQLGALTEGEELTELGEYLAALPVDPRLGKMILYGAAFQCLDPVLTIVSCCAYRDPFVLPLEQDRRRAQEVRRQLSHGSQCDLITMLHAFNGFQRLQTTQPGRVYAYCKEHFLHLSGMAMIADMKEQFFAILREAGLLDEKEAGGRERLVDYYNVNSGQAELIHAVVVSALYPNAAKVRFIGKGKGGDKGRKRAVLSTRDALSGLRIHPSSILDEKDLQPIAVDREAEVEDEDDDEAEGDEDDEDEDGASAQLVSIGKRRGVAPWVMYYEVTRSTQVFLRGASYASPWLLCFMASAAEQQDEQEEKRVEEGRAHREQSSSSEDEDEEAAEDDVDEDDDDEDEDGVDDEGGDIIVLNRNVNAQPAAVAPVASRPSKFVRFQLSNFIQYSMRREDAARMHAVRRYIHWLLHQRILRSHISLPLHQTDRGRQRTSQQLAQHEQLEKDVIALLAELLNEDASFSRVGGTGMEGQQVPSTYVQGGMRGMRGTRGGFDGARGGRGVVGRGAPIGRGRGGFVISSSPSPSAGYPVPGLAGPQPVPAAGQPAQPWHQQYVIDMPGPAPSSSHAPQYSAIPFIQPQAMQSTVSSGNHRPYYVPDQAWRATGHDASAAMPHTYIANNGAIGEQHIIPYGVRGGRGRGRGGDGQAGRGRGRGGRGGSNGHYQPVAQDSVSRRGSGGG